MQNRSFTVGDKIVIASMASAVRQDELLSIIAAPVFQSFAVAAQQGIPVNVKSIALRLMTLKPDDKAKVVDILTEKAVLQGTQVRISPKDFQGHMVEWNTLLAELLAWNLDDFFELLRSDLEPHEEEAKAAEVP